jgi:CDP-glucose 4,6-dehydratase
MINAHKKFFKNKKILITGNTGFKGSWLSATLIYLGANVVGLSIDIPTKPSIFELLKLKRKIKTYFFDINNIKKIKNLIKREKPDIIFHCAAQSLVLKSIKYPLETFNTNTIGSINLLESIKNYKKKLAVIMVTSDKCYYPTVKGYYKENSTLGGMEPYGASKAMAEIATKSYYESYLKKNKKINLVTVRAGNVIGGGDWSANRLLPDIFFNWKKNKTTTIRSPYANRPWQHVLEPVVAYIFIAKKIYNLSNFFNNYNIGPKGINNLKVINLLNLLNKKWKLKKNKFKIITKKNTIEAINLNLNVSKVKKEMSWENKLGIEDTIDFTCDWYKTYYTDSKHIRDITYEQIKKYLKIWSK